MSKIIKIALLAFFALGALLICVVLALNIAQKNEIYNANITLHAHTQNKIEGDIKFEKFAPLLRSKRIANVGINKYDFDNALAESIANIEHSGRKIYITLLDKNTLDSAKNAESTKSTQKLALDSATLPQIPQILGRVTYSINFIPAIWSIIKFYIKILLLCAGIYALFKVSRLKESSNILCVSYRAGIALFAFVVALFMLASIGFIAKINITQGYFYIALIISLICLLKGNPHKLLSIIVYGACFVVAVFMAFYCYDYSWDGRAYHQIGIYYLANGWNPIYLQMEEISHLSQFLSHQIWVEHYLKFAEITQASVYKTFGSIELGKAINYLFSFSAFCYGVSVLGRFRNINLAIVILLVFLAVFSPVVMAQIGTYYIDGMLGVAIAFVVFAMLDLDSAPDKRKCAIFILALLATASIKLTGIAYAGVIGIAYLCYKIYCKNFKEAKWIFSSGVIALALIVICNVNPLLTNQLQHGHFGYPLMGDGKIDIIASQQPQNFKDNNAFEKLAKSLFGKTQNIGQNGASTLKIPFIKYSDERLGDTDTRVGGFGYFFSGIVLLCLALVTLNIRRFCDKRFIFYFGAIAISVVINPEMWWARYVPQMWLLPFVVIVFSYVISLNKSTQILRNLIILFLMLSFISTYKLPLNTGYKNTINTQLANLCVDKNVDEKIYIYLPIGMEKSFGIKLLERGYTIEIIDKNAFEALSKEMAFYPLLNVLDNYGNNQSFWSVANSSCGAVLGSASARFVDEPSILSSSLASHDPKNSSTILEFAANSSCGELLGSAKSILDSANSQNLGENQAKIAESIIFAESGKFGGRKC